MPFYEYECPACKFYTEVLQKISDKPLKRCPSCGKAGFKRLVSAPVFRLKGSGWYETDFKSDKEDKRNLAGAERDAPAPASDAAAKPDDKTAAKPADSTPAPKPGKDKADARPAPARAGKPAARVRPAARTAVKRASARPARKAAGRRSGRR